jgi:hypothetical protein
LPAPSPNDVGTTQTNQTTASQVSVALQSSSPQGGTPTGPSLSMLSRQPSLTGNDGREDYVLLITDGLPNCNSTNANGLCACGTSCTPQQVSACQCTTSTCSGSLCSLGCLDSSGSVAAETSLANVGVKTIVVGFGPDVAAGSALTVLDAMARAGGVPRSCPNGTSAECGAGSTCLSNRTCDRAFYQASSSAELQGVLSQLF